MPHRNQSRIRPDSHHRRQQRAERRRQQEAAQKVQPAAEALQRYGNLAIAVAPGASEKRFLASLMAHYAKVDAIEETSTTFIDVNAVGAVYGEPMPTRAATNIFSKIAYATREPQTGRNKAVVIVRGVDHLAPSQRKISGNGHEALRTGLEKLIRPRADGSKRSSLDPAVVAIGAISDLAVTDGLMRRRVTGEDFIDAFHAHMRLDPDGNLTRYKIIPANHLYNELPSGTGVPLSIPMEYGGHQLPRSPGNPR